MHSVGVLPSLPVIPDSLDTRLAALIQNFVSAGPAFWNSAEFLLDRKIASARGRGLDFGGSALHDSAAEADQLSMTAQPICYETGSRRINGWSNNGVLDPVTTSFTTSSGTLLGLEESFGSHRRLNDRHFHYGCFIRAAAGYAEQINPSVCRSASQMLELLIRDYAGGHDDPMFPYLRNFDPAIVLLGVGTCKFCSRK